MTPVRPRRFSIDSRGRVRQLPPTPATSPSKANYAKRRKDPR